MSRIFAERHKEIEWRPFPARPAEPRRVTRSHLPAPLLIRDEMDPVQSQATGKMYDSKSALRREYKQLGLIEVGNDPQRLKPRPKPKVDRKKVRESLEKAEARFNRGERAR